MAELITSPTLLAHKVKELEEKIEYDMVMRRRKLHRKIQNLIDRI